MIVVDSSAIVDALTAVAGTEELRVRLSNEELHAPSLLDVEVVSVVRRLTLTGNMSASRGHDLLSDFDDLPIRRWPLAGVLRRRAFQLRDTISAYDAAYVVLAESLDCPLLTRDARLARAGGHGVPIEVL